MKLKLEEVIVVWETPATSYPLSKIGVAEICRKPQKRGNYLQYGLDGFATYAVIKPIPITELKISGKVWMVDDPPSWKSMEKFAKAADGDVLTTGLGLGLFAHALSLNPLVSSLTIIEINKDVIDLVYPLLPTTLPINVIHKDFYEYLEQKPVRKFDYVLIDLWVSKNKAQKLGALGSAYMAGILTRLAFPEARISLHGFTTLSDTQVIDREIAKEYIKIMS